MRNRERLAVLVGLWAAAGCGSAGEAPSLTGTWYMRGRTEVYVRRYYTCDVGVTCPIDSIVVQCAWSMTVSLARANSGYVGSYRGNQSVCSDGSTLAVSGAASAELTGSTERLGPTFPEYWPMTLRLDAPAMGMALYGDVVPPDSMYGSSDFAGYDPACLDAGGTCTGGSFVASQRAMPDGPLGLLRHPLPEPGSPRAAATPE